MEFNKVSKERNIKYVNTIMSEYKEIEREREFYERNENYVEWEEQRYNSYYDWLQDQEWYSEIELAK